MHERSTYQVLEALEDLARVEGDGVLVVEEWAPLRLEQRGQTAPWHSLHENLHIMTYIV